MGAELDKLAWSYRGFPFHTRVAYHGGGNCDATWTDGPRSQRIFAKVFIRNIRCVDGTVMCDMNPLRMKAHPGEPPSPGPSCDRQEWRFQPHQAPLSARIVWLMLETTCDWEAFHREAVERVLES